MTHGLAGRLLTFASAVLLTACATTSEILDDVLATTTGGGGSSLSSETVAAGLKEAAVPASPALTVGTGRVVDTLGVEGGFLKTPEWHIPLPDELAKAQDVASRFGLAGSFDTLETELNRAAEVATPKARKLFVDAVRAVTFDDAMRILRGPDDAATRYFEQHTATGIRGAMQPIVESSLADVGAARTFTDLAARYNALPLVKPIDADLNGHVLNYAQKAIFTQLAREEMAIRNNPAKRTTELLRRVFGSS